MIDFENDPFNVALREYRSRCKAHAEKSGTWSFIDARSGSREFRVELGPLLIVWRPDRYECETVFDCGEAHREKSGHIDYVSEVLVWEGLRLLRQHYILDEMAAI